MLDASGNFLHCDALNFDAAYQKMRGNSSAGSLSLRNSLDEVPDINITRTKGAKSNFSKKFIYALGCLNMQNVCQLSHTCNPVGYYIL